MSLLAVFMFCFAGTFIGGFLTGFAIDLWAQWDDNKFRRAVGLETKPLRLRRY